MSCEFCAAPGPRYDLQCDACCLRVIRSMPDRERRKQVLNAVERRRGKNAAMRVQKLVEENWNDR